MDTDSLNQKNMSEGKFKALELAEASRQEEWTHPSFVSELFKGNVHWNLLLPFPDQSAEDKAKGDAFLKKLESVLKEHIDPDKVDETGDVPQKALDELAKLKCFAMKIPEEYGGLGLSQINYNRAIHLLASYCSSTTVYLSAHQSIGVPQPLKLFGTDEQKKKYFPMFVKGTISAFALTEPDVGSDPAKMSTTAVPSEDGSHYILNGEKLWCTNGPVADVLIVMAQTPPKVVNGRERKQISAFIVDRSGGGIELVHRCQFMGLRGIQNGLLKFNNVKVPKENLLLGEGKGLKIALTTLNTGRLTMPAAATGGAKWCLKVVREWSKERVQWGSPIGKHEAIAAKISTMAATIFAMDAVTYLSAKMADDKNFDIRLEAAMAKLCCTEACWKIVDGAIQIRGGRGYETGPSLRARGEKGYAVERMLRDARINTIIEGTSQIMRLFIAREAMDMHVQNIMPLMSKKNSVGKKLGLAFKAFVHYAVWYPKQFIPSAQLPESGDIPDELISHMKFIGHSSRKLARNLFLAMLIHQQNLETKQSLMSRLVNIGTDLFAMSAACSKAIKLKKNNSEDNGSVKLADLFCRQATGRVKKHFRNLYRNADKMSYDLAQEILDDKYSWLENDIIDPQP